MGNDWTEALDVVEVGGVPQIVNTEVGRPTQMGVEVDPEKIASVPEHQHVISIPINREVAPQINQLHKQLQQESPQPILISYRGNIVEIPMFASLGSIEEENDFGLEAGPVINIFKAG